MSPDKIIVLVVALALIAGIVKWFFFRPTGKAVSAVTENNTQRVSVTVDGGYRPSVLMLKKDVLAELQFTRKDSSSCLEEVVFPDFGIREKLPLNKQHVIRFTPDKAGEFTYTCGMNMFFGKVVVQ